jgi:LysW-gamma-L-lysine carboxypeptidase
MSRELLIDLVGQYSPSGQEAPAAGYLVDWMGANGFDARVDSAGNAVGSRGPEDAAQTLMLLGHVDTVPGEIPVRVVDGELYGRGSVDAKGSLCTFAAATAQADLPPDWRVVVVGAVEEEVSSSRGARHVRERYEPTLCIIGEPSGVDRITLGYKGCVSIDYALTRPLAHSSRPEPSVGALGAQFWQDILAWAQAENASAIRSFDEIVPNLRQINTRSNHFHETVDLTVRFRLPPHLTPEAVVQAVTPFTAPDSGLRVYGVEQPYLGGKNNPLVRGLLAAIRAHGARPNFVLKGGTSDMNVVGETWACPMVAYGPGDSRLDHTPDERLPLEEYSAAVSVLRHFIEHLPALAVA